MKEAGNERLRLPDNGGKSRTEEWRQTERTRVMCDGVVVQDRSG